MGEHVKAHDIPNTELVSAGPGGVVKRVVPIPTGIARWTILLVPKDAGAAPDPTFTLKYEIRGQFFGTNPSTGPTTTVKNKANVITREDVVTKVEVTITLGIAPVPDGDFLISLYGIREN